MTELESYDLFGLKISVFTKEELIAYIDASIFENQKKVCFGYSLGYLSLFKVIKNLYEKTNGWDLMVTDGRYFYWYAKLFGAPLKFDISIPFLSNLMFQRASEKGYSVMLIGSDEDTNTKATNHIRLKYPGAVVYQGHTAGNFSEADQLEAVAHINKYKPNMLFIGASTPKKEEFTERWKGELAVNLIVPFGGMIDGLAGKVKLSSPLVKKLGLATVVRTVQEPKRLLRKNLFMLSEFFLKLLPLTVYHRLVLRKKKFNLIEEYLKR
jgi:N-acetylglucosaminyldiphosphoundecaprenol N-acetyl-beta-D-mannosaminyltransferase